MYLRARFTSALALLFAFQGHSLFAQSVSSAETTQLSGGSQNVSSPPASSIVSSLSLQESSTFAAYQTEQQNLLGGYFALLKSGATTQQIQVWRLNNDAQFQAQAQRAQALALMSESVILPASGTVLLPSGFSATDTEYINAQLALARSFTTDRKQIIQSVNSAGGTLTSAQMEEVNSSTMQSFVQQNAAALNQQSQRATALAAESVGVQPTPSSIVSAVPAGATSAEISLLNTRDQLRQQFGQFQTQYATASPAAREAAFQQWQQQNAALLQQFQTQAQNLGQSTPQN